MTSIVAPRGRILARSPADALLVGATFAHAGLLLAFPSAALLGVLLWWNANTVAHAFLHGPFFRSAPLNALFSAALSLLLGFPQALWTERHLAHHEGRPAAWPRTARMAAESALVLSLWSGLLLLTPKAFVTVYLPGWLLGMALCALQGRGEHLAAPAVDHRGRLYNLLFFNDGHHAAHHADPGLHWTRLPSTDPPGVRTNALPPVLRLGGADLLDRLERVALALPPARRFLLDRHARALGRLLEGGPPPARVAAVGGGLFPRTAILLTRLLPDAEVTVIDRDAEHLDRARPFLPPGVRTRAEQFDPARHRGYDLVVIPLAYRGDRAAIYASPPAPRTVVHDWLWRRRGQGVRVSFLLLKRMNLVMGRPAALAPVQARRAERVSA